MMTDDNLRFDHDETKHWVGCVDAMFRQEPWLLQACKAAGSPHLFLQQSARNKLTGRDNVEQVQPKPGNM